MARLVGDLRREEDPHLLGRRRAHDRPELVGDPLLADEERREPVHARVALLGRDPLVPVDPVLGEVEVLGRPLLALPQLVELGVAEQLEAARARRSPAAPDRRSRGSPRARRSSSGSRPASISASGRKPNAPVQSASTRAGDADRAPVPGRAVEVHERATA